MKLEIRKCLPAEALAKSGKIEIALALFIAAGIIAFARWLHPAVFASHTLLLTITLAAASAFISLLRPR